jgi:hypothetical protein
LNHARKAASRNASRLPLKLRHHAVVPDPHEREVSQSRRRRLSAVQCFLTPAAAMPLTGTDNGKVIIEPICREFMIAKLVASTQESLCRSSQGRILQVL